MGAATSSADSAKPLPLFRPEALAARQNLNGRILAIGPFSFRLFASLAALISITAIVFLLLARYIPTAKVLGTVSASHLPAEPQMQATFYVPEKWIKSVPPGTRLRLRCSQCSHPVSLNGTVLGLSSSTTDLTSEAPSSLAKPEPVYKVTVGLLSLNSPFAGADRVQPGTKLETEVPLESKPLIQWLIGALAG